MSPLSIRRRIVLDITIALGTLHGAPLLAQDRPPTPLTTKSSEFASPFSDISQLVETADGRVVVHDAIERRLGVADFRSGTFTDVGRQGGGPLEYRGVASLLRLPGDSVMVWDPANGRALLLSPSGTPAVTRAFTDARFPARVIAGFVPREADAHGNWYGDRRQVTSGDSTAVVRIVGSTGQQDTLAVFATPQLRPKRATEGLIKVGAPGFPPRGAWGVFRDGRVLVIHGQTYTPEVIGRDGSRAKAAAIPFPQLPVTEAERAAHLAEVGRQFQRMLLREMGGAARTQAPRVEVEPPAAWPPHQPPLLSSVIRIDSRGRAWVHVVDRDASAGDRFDLLDANGRRIGAIRMPKGVRVVGMGDGVVYAAREDADGLLHLQRYPLP